MHPVTQYHADVLHGPVAIVTPEKYDAHIVRAGVGK